MLYSYIKIIKSQNKTFLKRVIALFYLYIPENSFKTS